LVAAGAAPGTRLAPRRGVPPEGSEGMDPIQFLSQDHRKILAELEQIEAGPPEDRGPRWVRLQPELRVHERVEDVCLYHPIARDVGSADPTLAGWEWRHTEEVRELEALMSEMGRLEPSDSAWLDRLRRVRTRLESHIRDEERTIWPRVSRVWDAGRREQAGLEMERMTAERLGVGVRP